MPLTSGTRFGAYDIVATLGAGGMGEVYRARDSRLNRDVALKVLPQEFQLDPERLARFTREAQTLASLSHPHIGHIYGIEDAGGVPALVLELVEGPTLADHLVPYTKTGLPLEEALRIARQIAEALEAAHERGIVHRDLKPANIKISPAGVVKVLDFGLAKMVELETGEHELAHLSHSPTITIRGTREGVILGTAAYMSPEQARGQRVDKRTDVWAFGCVLYEMLTGRALFAGPTVSDTIASIIGQTPDWTKLPAATPPAVRRLLERCLAKDPRQRLRDLGDAQIEIADALAPSTETSKIRPAPRRSILLWTTVVAAAAIVAAGIAWRLASRSAPLTASGAVTRLVITPPAGDHLALDGGAIAQSPDGRRLAYVVIRGGGQQIYIRDLDQFEGAPVAGTEGGYNPFFSPDGQWLGFFAGGQLRKVLPGSAAVTISDAAINGAGTPRWEADDTILLVPVIGSPIMRVAASGGKPVAITTMESGENAHQWPQLLPGGKVLLFSVVGSNGSQIFAQSLADGRRRLLVQGKAGTYLPSRHLVYVQGGTVMGVRFDPDRLEVVGAPVAMQPGVLQAGRLRANATSTQLPQFSVATLGGTFAFVPASTGHHRGSLVWLDRSGAERPTGASGGDYIQPRLSPDGRRLAVIVGNERDDVWLFDLARQTWNRFTTEGNSSFPLWSPKSDSVVYASDRDGIDTVYSRALDGNSDNRLLSGDQASYPLSMSRDGRLAFVIVRIGRAQDIWTLDPDRSKPPVPWLETVYSEGDPTFSPDGRWIAYVSNESGRNEVYIRPFPGPGEKMTISTDGGNEAVWSRDGRELFYRNGTALISVDVSALSAGAPMHAGQPRKLFDAGYELSSTLWPNYDVSADGRQFLMIKALQEDAPAQINVVLNWMTDLERRLSNATR